MKDEYYDESGINGLKDQLDRTKAYDTKSRALVLPCPLGKWDSGNMKKHGRKRHLQAIRRILQRVY